MSVHMEHRISHHRSVIVCVKCGSYSVWVNQKLRRDCPGNPSKLGIKACEGGEPRTPPRPGQEWPLSVDVAPRPRIVVARVHADLGHFVPCPIPHGALGGGPGRRLVRERALPCGAATLLLAAACWRFNLQLLFSSSGLNAMSSFCVNWASRTVPGPCM